MLCNSVCQVAALERLRAAHGASVFDRSMWDFSMFHPTLWGHEQLAAEAHGLMGRFPKLLAPAPAPVAAAPAGYGGPKVKVQVKNVKGDLSVELLCEPNWSTKQLGEAAGASEALFPGSERRFRAAPAMPLEAGG